MGMDVCGKNPTSKEGEYFCNNVWWWHPLAEYACRVAPEVTLDCEYWHTNDGDGLDADGAAALADALDAEIESGRAKGYERKWREDRADDPEEPSGFVTIDGKAVPTLKIDINNIEKHYRFDVENLSRFVKFLRASGGFEIW